MVYANDAEVALTWYDLGQPMILHTQPNSTPGRPYGVCTLFVPAGGARLTVNGVQAKGRAWPRERDGTHLQHQLAGIRRVMDAGSL